MIEPGPFADADRQVFKDLLQLRRDLAALFFEIDARLIFRTTLLEPLSIQKVVIRQA